MTGLLALSLPASESAHTAEQSARLMVVIGATDATSAFFTEDRNTALGNDRSPTGLRRRWHYAVPVCRGDPNYKRLISTPGLRATVVVDREASQIMSIRFHGRR